MNDIYEKVRRMEFNKTEPETLMKLVERAIKIGDEIREEFPRFRQLTKHAIETLVRRDLIRQRERSSDESNKLSSLAVSATDGSYYPAGGVNGYWYVPVSVALIIFTEGLRKPPQVKVSADIFPIDERKTPNPYSAMEEMMLLAEANTLKDWSHQCPEGIIHFVDGPAIDPPRLMTKEYVDSRVKAIQACLDKKVFMICCVKKLLGNFLMLTLEDVLLEVEKARIGQFGSDAYMIYHVFTMLSLESEKTIYTKPLEVPKSYQPYKQYSDAGLTIYFMYYQREPRARPFRVDIPVLKGTEVDTEELGARVAATLDAFSYPGYDLPVPLILAHNKCNIRKGCAEVLYNEVITRAASSNLFDNLVRKKISTEVF